VSEPKPISPHATCQAWGDVVDSRWQHSKQPQAFPLLTLYDIEADTYSADDLLEFAAFNAVEKALWHERVTNRNYELNNRLRGVLWCVYIFGRGADIVLVRRLWQVVAPYAPRPTAQVMPFFQQFASDNEDS